MWYPHPDALAMQALCDDEILKTMNNELKPCPHCKCTDLQVHTYSEGEIDHTQVACPECGMQGPVGPDTGNARQRWNALPREERK